MNSRKKLVLTVLAALATFLLTAADRGAPAAAPAASLPPQPAQVIMMPRPTAGPPAPCDLLGGDLAGADAAAMEQVFSAWGFKYFAPDGKWGAGDRYELTLFQRWARLQPTGEFDNGTRRMLMLTWKQTGDGVVKRIRLPLEGRTIGVNPGHQRKANPGLEPVAPGSGSPMKAKVSSGTQGVATRVPEYVVTLQVGLKLRARLEALGARVLMSRTTHDVDISNGDRARAMNTAGADVCLSLHCDGSTSASLSGLHTIMPALRGYQTGGVLAESQRFGGILQQECIKGTGARDRGLGARSDLTSLNWAKMPACLVEMGYMTNAAEDKKLVSSAYQDKLAAAMANALLRFFKEMK